MSTPTKQVVRRYVELVAEYGPLAPRLRKFKSEERADIIDRATARVCRGLPNFIDSPDYWPFFEHSPRDVRTMLLVHRALDAAKHEYEKQTDWSGGDLEPTPEALARRDRFTDSGQHNVNDPERVLARQEREDAEQRALDIQAAENAGYMREADEYAAKQTKPKHIEAVRLLRLGLSYDEIRRVTCKANGKGGISERILKPHRDALAEIANRCLLTDDDGLPYTDVSPLSRPVADGSSPEVPQTEVPSDEVLAAETPVEQVVTDEDGNETTEMSGNFETPTAPVAVAPINDTDLGEGNSRTAAAYSIGEAAQFDARDRTDRGDSANYRGAPKKVSGFTNHMARDKGEPRYGSNALADGAERAPWTMTEPPRGTITDAYADLLKAIETARVEGTFDPSRVESERRRYWDPNAAGAGGGAWIDTPPQAAVVPRDQKAKRSRGDGRVQISARKERVARLQGYALDGAARDLRRQATEATAVAKKLTAAAREAENWERLRKITRKVGIPEGELRRLKSQFDRHGMSIYKAFGLDDLLRGVLESAANDEPSDAEGAA